MKVPGGRGILMREIDKVCSPLTILPCSLTELPMPTSLKPELQKKVLVCVCVCVWNNVLLSCDCHVTVLLSCDCHVTVLLSCDCHVTVLLSCDCHVTM